MRIDRAGIPFIAAALVPAGGLLLAGWPLSSIPFAVVGVFFLFFFRDPHRHVPDNPSAVASPADGRVLIAGAANTELAPPGQWQQISIFLSPVDVHVNRIPMAGQVTRVEYRPGALLPAYRREAASENERTEVWIRLDNGQDIVCRQVVGMLARRIVCRVAPGAHVGTGERFGIMKFGSRIDLFLPVTAVLRVAPGDTVRGGETVLATM